MDPEHPVWATQAAETGTQLGDDNREIARQDATIQAIEVRLAEASGPRSRFSFTALRNELAIEQELAAARDDRGALLYDLQFARARQG